MADPIQIRLGGYGPETTTHSRALKFIGDGLEAEFGDEVEVKYVWNIMDLGYRGEDILWLAESGVLTIGYQSTSYLTDRVPELGFADLPFLFPTLDAARAAYDGGLGRYLTQKIEQRCDYKLLGFFENGFRHISNNIRPVERPADLKDMKIRVLPSRIHARTFELLGAQPVSCDLTEAIQGVRDGTLDAQENPFANTTTYDVHKLHKFHTLSGHFYLTRCVFCHRQSFEGWPDKLRAAVTRLMAEATAYQRGLAVAEEDAARALIEAEDGKIIELAPGQLGAFRAAVEPIHAEARGLFDPEMFDLLDQ